MPETASIKTAPIETASIALSPSVTVFSRLLAMIDRVLMANARIAIRNGDLPRFGL